MIKATLQVSESCLVSHLKHSIAWVKRRKEKKTLLKQSVVRRFTSLGLLWSEKGKTFKSRKSTSRCTRPSERPGVHALLENPNKMAVFHVKTCTVYVLAAINIRSFSNHSLSLWNKRENSFSEEPVCLQGFGLSERWIGPHPNHFGAEMNRFVTQL